MQINFANSQSYLIQYLHDYHKVHFQDDNVKANFHLQIKSKKIISTTADITCVTMAWRVGLHVATLPPSINIDLYLTLSLSLSSSGHGLGGFPWGREAQVIWFGAEGIILSPSPNILVLIRSYPSLFTRQNSLKLNISSNTPVIKAV